MKNLLPVFTLTLATTGNVLMAQNQYEILTERPNEKTIKGIISRQVLLGDTSFRWYAENLKGYQPNTAALEGLQKQKDSV
jgi:hypothetical protein